MAEHKKVVMFPSRDPKDLEQMACPGCGFTIFVQVWKLLFMPGIISPTGKDTTSPIGPMYMCANPECGKISKPFELVREKPKTEDAG